MNKVYPLDVSAAYPRSGTTQTGSVASADASLRGIFRALQRRLGLMLAIFLLTFAAVAIYTFQQTPEFTAKSSLVVNQRQTTIDLMSMYTGLPSDSAMLDTEVEILRSRSLIGKVVSRLNLIEDPEFNPSRAVPSDFDVRMDGVKSFIKGMLGMNGKAKEAEPTPEERAQAQVDEFEAVVDAVQRAISVSRLGTTYIVEIDATSRDPKTAADLANTVAEVYLSNQMDQKYEQTRRIQDWLDARTEELREEVRVAESRVADFMARTGTGRVAGGATIVEQQIRDINSELTAARGTLAEKTAILQNVKSQIAAGKDVDSIAAALQSTNIVNLRQQQTEIARRKAELEVKYLPSHPDVERVNSEMADINRRIDAELQRIVSSLEQDVVIANQRVRSLQTDLARAKGELAGNNVDAVKLSELEREAEASRNLLSEFTAQAKQTREQSKIAEADAVINAEAPVPRGPSFPNIPLNLVLGVMLGMAMAGAAGVLTELLDNYISNPEEVEGVTGLPYIGQIPLLPGSSGFNKAKTPPGAFLVEKPHSGFAEAFRHLRASIMFADLDKAAKTVAVVSSLPDEGKTSVTYCLGRVSAMSGTKTIIIDGDLRRRQLTEVSGAEHEAGLLEYLFGEARLSDVIWTDESTGLDILPLSDRKHTPRDVFGSRAFDALLNMLQQTYDLIIIDTGPILLMAETRVVTSKVDQVVLAARWRKTSRGAIRDTVKILRDFRANITGVVLTFVDLRKKAYHAYSAANYGAYAKYYQND
ncbi:MAG: polysaccharide biosynthesis tyrosine autokinase [Hyphomonadaceae bacterium]